MLMSTFLARYDDERKVKEFNNHFNADKHRIKSKIYRFKNYLIYHIIVPSQSTKDTYDVIIEVDIGNSPTATLSVLDCEMKLFSNNRSTIFIHNATFKKYDLLLKWTEFKMDKPVGEIKGKENFHDRSIYLALMHIFTSTNTLAYETQRTAIRTGQYRGILATIRSYESVLNKDVNTSFNRKGYSSQSPSTPHSNKKETTGESASTKKNTSKATNTTKKIKFTRKLKKTKKI